MHGSAVTIPPANSLGLGSTQQYMSFFDYFFSVNIKKEKSI